MTDQATDDAQILEEYLAPAPRRKKFCYIGAPHVFALTQACQDLGRAFDSYGIYVVGSALQRPDFRDVDVRMIMADEDFAILFPDAGESSWEFDQRWLWLTISISERLSKLTGLPVDFQFQRQSHANAVHKGDRQCICMTFAHKQQQT